MDSIQFLTYVAISHYTFSIITSIYTFIRIENKLDDILDELAELKNQIEINT
jgi:hypothetical protein